jgi:uncharacterized protein (DUF697 family)
MQTDLQGNLETPVANAENFGAATAADQPLEATNPVQSAGVTEEKTAERSVQAEAARARAASLMTERRFAEARKALEEADTLEAEPSRPQRVLAALRSHLPKLSKSSPGSEAAEAEKTPEAEAAPLTPVDQAMAIVSLYSKIAVVVGLLPGGLLNFAGILAVQITMVWKIANAFGHHEGKERIRGSLLSLFGSAIPTGVGAGVTYAVAAIPAVVTGTVLGFVITPVLAYALTRAVGSAFIMHFESGGTLLTFDPKAFRDYFLKEFQNAGGTLKTPA